MNDARRSLGAKATPAWRLSTACTTLVHCGAPSGAAWSVPPPRAGLPSTKTYGLAAASSPALASHAVSSAHAATGTGVELGPKMDAVFLCASGVARSSWKPPAAVGLRVTPSWSLRATPTRSGGTTVSHVSSAASKSRVRALDPPSSLCRSYSRTARARAVRTADQSS
eukprot:scaffold13821_cov68-Phaeocystis_antarctica.AAC.7